MVIFLERVRIIAADSALQMFAGYLKVVSQVAMNSPLKEPELGIARLLTDPTAP